MGMTRDMVKTDGWQGVMVPLAGPVDLDRAAWAGAEGMADLSVAVGTVKSTAMGA